jgi:uncharacterized OB-fold protein
MTMFSSRNWREYPQRYRLEAVRFKKSGKTYFPPRDVDMTDGTRIFGQMTDCDVEKVRIGDEVRLEFRRIQEEGHHGVISYGYKFVPKWY